MVNYRPIALAGLCMVVALACSSGGAELPEDMARMAFEALKTGSAEPFQPCLPTTSDIEELLETIREKGSKEEYEEARQNFDELGGAEKHAAEMADNVRNGIERIRKKLSEFSPPIDWSKAEFGGLDEEQTRVGVEIGLNQADVFFRVKVGEVTHTVMLYTCLQADRGWVIGGGIRLVGRELEARAAGSSGPVAETPEDLARLVFKALKEGSAGPLEGCLPTGPDVEEVLEMVREKGSKSDYEGTRAFVEEFGGARRAAENQAKDIREALEWTRKSLAEAKPPIDWSKAEFAGLDEERTRRRMDSGVEEVGFTFRVKAGDTTYLIKLADCVRVKRGWLCFAISLQAAPGYEIKKGD